MKIKVYAYCSYKSSPVGYQYGVFQVDSDKKKEEYITPDIKENIPPLVKNVIDNPLSNGVNIAVGKLPNSKEYIIVIKNLKCKFTNEDGKESIKYGNFIFSTTDESDCKALYNKISRQSKEELSNVLDSFLIFDPNANKGEISYKIDTKKFIDFINISDEKSNLNSNTENFNVIDMNSINEDKSIKITVKDDLNHISDDNSEQKKDDNSKQKKTFLVPVITLIGLIMIIIVLMIKFLNLNSNLN